MQFDKNELFNEVNNRTIVRMFIIEDYLACTWMCLSDVALMIQYSSTAIDSARKTFKNTMKKKSGSKHQLLNAVGDSRYHFDYFVNSFYAGFQHLASAAIHLENKENEPLFAHYPTVTKAISKKLSNTISYDILSKIQNDPNCKIILEYRNKWLHRGIPVLKGEFRFSRRLLWADTIKIPGTHILTIEKNGKKSTLADGLFPEYDIENLFDVGESALHQLNTQSKEFIKYYDEYFIKIGRAKINQDGEYEYT